MTTDTKPRTRKPAREAPVEEIQAEPETTITATMVVDESAQTSYPGTGGNPEHALVPAQPLGVNAGVMALAMMDDAEFNERLDAMKRGRERISLIQRELMEPGVDFGLIPGTPKPTLFKSGAEKLALAYGLAARLENTFVPGDGETQPLLKYESAAFLHLGSFDGPVVAVGHGTANGWEKRYRRDSDKACPACGKMALIRSKFEPGWYCFPKKDGCGSKFGPDDERITAQATDAKGDPVAANDLQNTLLKMSEKRAFVDGVLRATASSSLFTQDVAEEPTLDDPPDQLPGRVTAGGAVINTDGEVVERREDTSPEPEAVHEPMAVERGGHVDRASGAQVESVKKWSKSMKLGPYKLADEISLVVGGGIDSTELDEDVKAAATKVQEFLENMSSTDIGNLITHLKTLSERS
jgi:hypothetical protein